MIGGLTFVGNDLWEGNPDRGEFQRSNLMIEYLNNKAAEEILMGQGASVITAVQDRCDAKMDLDDEISLGTGVSHKSYTETAKDWPDALKVKAEEDGGC
jgi:hypothetical protein